MYFRKTALEAKRRTDGGGKQDCRLEVRRLVQRLSREIRRSEEERRRMGGAQLEG